MTKASKPEASFDRLKSMVRSSWILQIQMELIKHDENAMLVTVENCDLFLGLTPQQAAEKVIQMRLAEQNND